MLGISIVNGPAGRDSVQWKRFFLSKNKNYRKHWSRWVCLCVLVCTPLYRLQVEMVLPVCWIHPQSEYGAPSFLHCLNESTGKPLSSLLHEHFYVSSKCRKSILSNVNIQKITTQNTLSYKHDISYNKIFRQDLERVSCHKQYTQPGGWSLSSNLVLARAHLSLFHSLLTLN